MVAADRTRISAARQREAIVEHYRHRARGYDRATRRFDDLRREAVDRLALLPGENVVDVGCGTGVALPWLVDRVGVRGRVVGVDASPQMLRFALKRREASGWRNVTLVEGLVEHVSPEASADAALICLTHDVMRSEQAIANLTRHLTAGARIVAVGVKRAPRWKVPVNANVRWRLAPLAVTPEGLDAPWAHLAARLVEFQLAERDFGGAYVAWGRLP